MDEHKRGDIVRAQGRRGKYQLRTPMMEVSDGMLNGWWAIRVDGHWRSTKRGKVYPIRIKEKR